VGAASVLLGEGRTGHLAPAARRNSNGCRAGTGATAAAARWWLPPAATGRWRSGAAAGKWQSCVASHAGDIGTGSRFSKHRERQLGLRLASTLR
jgi:hypothetical protein